MKVIISILVIILTSVSANASLMDEVDQLTPEQAYELVQKLKGKTLDPIPVEFFTKLAASMTTSYVMTDPKVFKSSLDARFNELSKLDKSVSTSVDIMWRLSDSLRLGFEVGYVATSANAELEANLFESVKLKSLLSLIKIGYKVNLTDSFTLYPYLGLGTVNSDINILRTSDTLTTSEGAVKKSHSLDLEAMNFGFKAGAALNYQFNSIFSIGLDLSMLQDKVTKLKRSGVTEVASPSELDMSGFGIGLRTSINL